MGPYRVGLLNSSVTLAARWNGDPDEVVYTNERVGNQFSWYYQSPDPDRPYVKGGTITAFGPSFPYGYGAEVEPDSA
jgi:hypothetical protein